MWLTLIWFLVAAIAALVAYLIFDWILTIAIVTTIVLVAIWILGCTLSPAIPDRRCPKCGDEGLVKLRRGEPLGVRCELCGFEDETRHVAYLDEW